MCKCWYLVEERFVVGEQMMFQGLRRRRGGDGGHSRTIITIDDDSFVDGAWHLWRMWVLWSF
jgi:hypothetical protein